MHNFTVFASAGSRLHADVILIRLRRAEIDCHKISVLFPIQSMPNAVGCWLPIASTSKFKFGRETIACAGLLRKQSVAATHSRDDGRAVGDLLTHAGVDDMGAHILAERLGQGHILLGVHAKNEAEVSIAWHVFRHSRADTIIVNTTWNGGPGRPHREIQQVAPWVPAAA